MAFVRMIIDLAIFGVLSYFVFYPYLRSMVGIYLDKGRDVRIRRIKLEQIVGISIAIFTQLVLMLVVFRISYKRICKLNMIKNLGADREIKTQIHTSLYDIDEMMNEGSANGSGEATKEEKRKTIAVV